MKNLILALTFLATIPAQAAPEPTHFVCGSNGKSELLSVEFDGPRYADFISVAILGEEAQQLLLPSERGLDVTDMSIQGNLAMGSCEKGEGDVLVSCSRNRRGHDRAWSFLNYSFTKRETLAPDHEQTVDVRRNAHDSDFELVVTRRGTDAHLHLTMTLDTAAERGKRVVIDHKLATLENNWVQCKFE